MGHVIVTADVESNLYTYYTDSSPSESGFCRSSQGDGMMRNIDENYLHGRSPNRQWLLLYS